MASVNGECAKVSSGSGFDTILDDMFLHCRDMSAADFSIETELVRKGCARPGNGHVDIVSFKASSEVDVGLIHLAVLC